jgi:Fe-S cluster assembly iron-binding protein IscA
MLTLTDDAAQAIEEMLAAPGMPEGAGVRITAAVPSTDAGAAPGLQAGLAPAPEGSDEVIEEAGARVFVEDTVAGLLDDKFLDADASGDKVLFSIASAA